MGVMSTQTSDDSSIDVILKDNSGDFLYFTYFQQISCLDPNQHWTDLLTSIVCVSKSEIGGYKKIQPGLLGRATNVK